MADNHQVVKQLLPGIILSALIMLLGIYLSILLGKGLIFFNILPEGSASPISGIFVAIAVGLLVRNIISLPNYFMKGISFSVKYALRAGIILLGLRLSLVEALKLGAWGIPLIVSCISVGLIITLYFTKKMQQSERLGTLIACGTGICGVTAIMATSPVIRAKDNEISYAVANVTIFGLMSMLCYPFLAYLFFSGDPVKAGLFLGTAVHDTAQVTGAALIFSEMYDLEAAVNVATVTKLTRNLFIIAVIPLVSYLFFKNAPATSDSEANTAAIPKWYQLIPLFVIGFLCLACIRTIGDMTLAQSGKAFSLLAEQTWRSFYEKSSSFGTTYLLGTAMAGVGLSTDFKMFKGLGLNPFYIELIAAISVGFVSLVLISFFA